jgi:hypothetical protein
MREESRLFVGIRHDHGIGASSRIDRPRLIDRAYAMDDDPFLQRPSDMRVADGSILGKGNIWFARA